MSGSRRDEANAGTDPTIAGPSAGASAPTLIASEANDEVAETMAGTAVSGAPVIIRGPRSRSPQLGRGAVIGRYVVVDELGAGGMGVVYAAYDPKLNRRVALKLVKGGHDPASGIATRMEREAQALARLSHPNVVAIYDVGALDDQLFLAMELVEGQTLSEWMKSAVRSWRDTVAVFVGAGRGLAAAHAAGVIHRDFKPSNVIVGNDGRPRVLDFGLARGAGGDDAVDPDSFAMRASANDILDAELTRAGSVMGTPVYMPPEAHRGEVVGPEGDQFSFCVGLYEGLYGARPFDKRTGDQLPAIPPPPPDTKVPGWLRKVVLKGLETRIEDRFASMDQLLAALEDDPAIKRRKWMLAAAGVAVISALVVGALALRRPAVATGPCAVEAPFAGVWDAAVRARVQQQFAASGAPDAATMFDKTAGALDAATQEWLAAHASTCSATKSSTNDSQALHLIRLECLDRQREDLSALVGLLARADAQIVTQSTAAVNQLARPALCDNRRSHLYIAPPPVEAAHRVNALRKRMSEAQALMLTGKERESGEQLDAIVKDARVLGYPPLLAEALYLRGRRRLKDFATSIQILDEAERVAIASRSDTYAARAAALRLREGAVKGADAATIDGWTERARAWVQRDGDLEAEFAFEQSLGILAQSRGDHAGSIEHLTRAVDLGTRAFGPVNTRVFGIQTSLALSFVGLGRYDDAVTLLGGAIQTFERSYGSSSIRLVNALDNYGLALVMVGRNEEARKALDRALVLSTEPSLSRGAVLCDSARVALAEGNLELASRRADEGVALLRKLGVEKMNLAVNYDPLVAAHQAAGRHADALQTSRACLAEFEKAGNHGPDTVACASLQGAALIDLAQPSEAVAVLESALAIQLEHPAAPGVLANLRFQLGRALLATNGDRVRIAGLLADARKELERYPFKKSALEALDVWRAKHNF